VHQPIDRIGLERRKRILKALFEKYRRLRDEGRLEEANEHLRITTLYANASLEEELHDDATKGRGSTPVRGKRRSSS
jgi:hypothetical protein